MSEAQPNILQLWYSSCDNQMTAINIQRKPNNNTTDFNSIFKISGFSTYYLAEEIRRSEGIQLLETRELLPNTRPRFEVPKGLSGFGIFSVGDLGMTEEVDGPLFTFCKKISQSNELLQPNKNSNYRSE